MDKGLITPILFQMPDGWFVRLTVASLFATSWVIATEEVVQSIRMELELLVTNGRISWVGNQRSTQEHIGLS